MPAANGAAGHRLAVDMGGTFIDFVLLDEATGEVAIEKQASTRDRLAEEFVAGARRLPRPLAEVDRLFHGTTVAINAILQDARAPVGLITTAGYRDTLVIGRTNRPEIYNWYYRPPQPLVPRHLCREVGGRIDHTGTEIEELDLEAVEREADALVAEGVRAIAVCFLHAYASGRQEAAAVECIRARHAGLIVTASHELAPEWREFERMSTTVLNAAIEPVFSSYLEDLSGQLKDEGYAGSLALMQSNGGVISAPAAASRPIRTLESGPAGGVIGASVIGAELGRESLICGDVGGTSYDVAIIHDGVIAEKTMADVVGRPVIAPTIDIVSIGAGGGSIASLDHRDAIRVGPRSAGATPGPACFGRGGTEPTVTDCQLLLGRLDAQTFLGNRMQLDIEAAERAVGELAEGAGLSTEEAAVGILTLAETNMTYAIRGLTVERGIDPREFAYFSYGGGGGLFAARVAEELGVDAVIVPAFPANFSAWGILCADYVEDVARMAVRPFEAAAEEELPTTFADLREVATATLTGFGFAAEEIRCEYRADVRFAGQEHTITVFVEPEWVAEPSRLPAELPPRFVALHRQRFSHGEEGAPLEVVTCRCRAIGPVVSPARVKRQGGRPAEPRGTRRVRFDDGFVETPVWDRDALAPGQRLEGPAMIEEWASTTVMPPGWTARQDELGTLFMEVAR